MSNRRSRPDIVYTVKAGPNPELRYSLRSLVNLPHSTVWVAGGAPGWLAPTACRIPNPQDRSKYANSGLNLRAAIESDLVAEWFYLFNDDFFVTAPLDHVPIHHRGPVSDLAATYEARFPHSPYTRGMRTTLAYLRGLGIDEPLSYELHMPMLVQKSNARLLTAQLDDHRDRLYERPIHWRTIYGNLFHPECPRTEDVKVNDLDAIPSGPLVSTSDEAFAAGAVGVHLRELFPTRSIYELEKEPIMKSHIKLPRPLTTVLVGVRFRHGVATATLTAAQRRFLTARGAKITEPEAVAPVEPSPPSMAWTVKQIEAYAADHQIDLAGAKTKAEKLARL